MWDVCSLLRNLSGYNFVATPTGQTIQGPDGYYDTSILPEANFIIKHLEPPKIIRKLNIIEVAIRHESTIKKNHRIQASTSKCYDRYC